MNEEWIDDSHNNAKLFRNKHHSSNKAIQLVRILDASGMFETGWLIFDHLHHNYGYPQ